MISKNLLNLMEPRFNVFSWVRALEIPSTLLIKAHINKGFSLASPIFVPDYRNDPPIFLLGTVYTGGEWATSYSVKISNLDVIRLLLEKGTPKSSDIVTSIVRVGDLQMLKFLLERGFPVEEETLIAAIEQNNYRAVKMLMSTNYAFDQVVALTAILEGSKKIFNTMLKKGVKINPKIVLGLRPQDFKNLKLKLFFKDNFHLLGPGIKELESAGKYESAKILSNLMEELIEQVR